MEDDSVAQPESLACPICDRALTRRIANGWLAIFECDRCGEFSDFGDGSPSPAQNRRGLQLHRPAGTTPSES
jgi:ribosomal protein L37AE/L43A